MSIGKRIEREGLIYVRAAEIAAHRGVTLWWIREMARQKKIPSIKVGKAVWFNMAQVDAVLDGTATETQQQEQNGSNDRYSVLNGI